ncbi:MAG: beta-galactosidase, partial [Clostridia bacterium]|nr:beta-galactosidase [Clostridia bacterium]
MNIPRSEHPNPQFFRENWKNLNGTWDFEIDYGTSGHERGMEKPDYKMNSKIVVPFCPESKLSGIEHKDFMNCVWYQRTIEVTEEQMQGRIILHFGAVDHEAFIYVNGKQVATHKGGYTGFEA